MTIRELFAVKRSDNGVKMGERAVLVHESHTTSTASDRGPHFGRPPYPAPDLGDTAHRPAAGPLTLRDFLRIITKPLLMVAIFLSVMTFTQYINGNRIHMLEWFTRKFDLTQEMNYASWSEGIMFLLVGLSYALIALSPNGIGVVPAITRLLFIGFALASCFLSIDEMFIIHERIGMSIEAHTGLFAGTELAHHGFSWLIPYAPAFLFAIFVIAMPSLGLIGGIRDQRTRIVARRSLVIGISFVPVLLLSEVVQGALWYLGTAPTHTLMSPFEESAELVVLGGLFFANYLIARSYDL